MNYHVEVPAKVEKYILSLPIKIALQITERINLLAENPRPTNFYQVGRTGGVSHQERKLPLHL